MKSNQRLFWLSPKNISGHYILDNHLVIPQTKFDNHVWFALDA